MNRTEMVPHIAKAWTYAKHLGIGELFVGPTALDASEGFKRTSVDPDTSYEALYLAGLRGVQYNILLRDFSFLQFGVGSVDGVRYAYYPNPFLGVSSDAVSELTEMQEYVAEGILDMEEFLHRVSEIRNAQHPPLVRYEFSKHQYVEATHPSSHMHLGFHSDNRWPLKRYLTAHSFSLFLFRIFYLNFWMEAQPLRVGDRDMSMDELLAAARAECRILYGDEFSAAEGRRFYFT